MAKENEDYLHNKETDDEKQTKKAKSGKNPLINNTGDQVTINGTATDEKTQSKGSPGPGSGGVGDYMNIRATTSSASMQMNEKQQQQQPTRREENPFSFKHFLNRDTTPGCSSSTGSFVINSTSVGSDAESSGTGGESSKGQRSKVPQSSSSSVIVDNACDGGGGDGSNEAPNENSRMKRSPRFSSFDSQASLADYAAKENPVLETVSSSTSGIKTRSSPTFRISQNPDEEAVSSSASAALRDDSFVPRRSYSNYDMEGQPSPRRRAPDSARTTRPFPTSQLNSHHLHNSPSNASTSGQRAPNAEYAAAAALPDFVQDHLMDSYYCNEMNPNSSNSPVDIVGDITGGAANAVGAGSSGVNASDTKCQTLPDFLSDGPIIHSSQRLADVAAGLPSTSMWSNMDSPEDESPSLLLSRLKLENERLCIELNETRQALGEQTRRSNELERTLEQTRSIEQAYNRTMAQNIVMVEENLDQSRKRTEEAQSNVTKLTQQVKQLTAEVNMLRRENELLREGDGDLGGISDSERPSTSHASRNRPSRSQLIARELLRAASTAESNLRHLLAGVENLRQMASDIQHRDTRFDYDDVTSVFPPMTDDYLDDYDDYDKHTGGPAL